MKTLAIALLIVLNAVSVIAAPHLNSADVTQFDIAGVKLGMTYEQAVEALHAKWDVKSEQFINVDKEKNPLSGKEAIKNFSVEGKGYVLLVKLSPGLQQPDVDTYRVWFIEYNVKVKNDVNNDVMKKAAIQKYGEKFNFNAKRSFDLFWCKSPVKKWDGPILCNINEEPVLRLSGSVLQLSNDSMRRKLIRYIDEKNAIKPNF